MWIYEIGIEGWVYSSSRRIVAGLAHFVDRECEGKRFYEKLGFQFDGTEFDDDTLQAKEVRMVKNA